MFIVGKIYRITLAGSGPDASFKGAVLKYEFPLLSIELGQGERIVNVNSPAFVRADRHDAETLAEQDARQETARRSLGRSKDES